MDSSLTPVKNIPWPCPRQRLSLADLLREAHLFLNLAQRLI